MKQVAGGVTLAYEELYSEAVQYRGEWLATHNGEAEAKLKTERVEAILANIRSTDSAKPQINNDKTDSGTRNDVKAPVHRVKKKALVAGQSSIIGYLSGTNQTKGRLQAAGAENEINGSSSSSSRAGLAVCDVYSVNSKQAKTGETPLDNGSVSSVVQLPVARAYNPSSKAPSRNRFSRLLEPEQGLHIAHPGVGLAW